MDDPDLCWVWTAYVWPDGYGCFWLNGKNVRAHRASWELTHERPIPYGLLICHTCDNRKCVNPKHLFVGTYRDNIHDCREKGRIARGELQGLSKLTEKKVVNIRKLREKGLTWGEIGEMVGVDRTTASKAYRGRTWAHISFEEKT
jgi:hypothetical protein